MDGLIYLIVPTFLLWAATRIVKSYRQRRAHAEMIREYGKEWG
jgi:hypothetical protein